MARRQKFDVTPDKRSGEWIVKSGCSAERFSTKQEAVNAAAKTARSNGNAQVGIRKKDGSMQSERTYGNDPRRSKD